MPVKPQGGLSYPVNVDNEALIISNAIQDKKNRDIFCRLISYEKFRSKEFQTLAWGIIEASRSELDINIDAVLLKAKSCPVRQAVDFKFIQSLITNFPIVPEKNFKEHLSTLTADSTKEALGSFLLDSVLPACFDTSTTVAELDTKGKYWNSIVERGYSASRSEFKTMEEVAHDYDLAKSSGMSKRTTGLYQLDECLTEGFKDGQITTIAGLSSMGKCLGVNTPVIMFDGSTKYVQDIRVGEYLMGPDSTPRKVLSTTSGTDVLYKIKQKRGEDYIVNSQHILSLQRSGRPIKTRIGLNKKGKRKVIGWNSGGEIINIPLVAYLEKSKNWKNTHVGYRAQINFREKSVKIDPYYLGCWLGDGNNHDQNICNPEPEIRGYLEYYAKFLGLIYRERVTSSLCFMCLLVYKLGTGGDGNNVLLNYLREYNLIKNKHIPDSYKYNSREVRMQVLAGLLDTDGYMTSKIHEISTKYDRLKDDILYLARSLGFYATAKYETKSIKKLGFSKKYWRIRISGYNHLIPCLVKRKKASVRNKKDSPLRTGISVEKIGVGEYYGFELEGDGLFLLGDFTVTHNSSLALTIMKNLSHSEAPVPTAQFALEMNNTSIFTKFLAFKSQLSISTVIKNPEELSQDERKSYEHEKSLLAKNKHIFLSDNPSRSIASMREQILLLQDKIKQQYIVVIVDLFGKLKDFQSSDNFARDYEKKLNQIQVMVRELGIHMILVTQINREVSKRKNKRPTMNDLKNAHALTEVSDIMLGLHRPYFDPTEDLTSQLHNVFDDDDRKPDDTESSNDPTKNITEVIVMKQRMGPKDILINFMFDPNTTCFCAFTEEHQKMLNLMKLDDEV